MSQLKPTLLGPESSRLTWDQCHNAAALDDLLRYLVLGENLKWGELGKRTTLVDFGEAAAEIKRKAIVVCSE